jgi:hypothetical protein
MGDRPTRILPLCWKEVFDVKELQMSLCRRFYEKVVGQILSIDRFKKSEHAPLESGSIIRLRAISQQCARRNMGERLPLSASGSAKANGSSVVLGVDRVSAIVQKKEKVAAERRARVTSTRLNALKTYLEQGPS